MKILSILLLLVTGSISAQQTLFFNGKIFTGNKKQPFVHGILIQGQNILAVGELDELEKILENSAKKIDLRGRVMIPGLIDSHIHAIDGGESLLKPNIDDQGISIQLLAAFADSLVQNKLGYTDGVLDIYGLNISTWAALDSIEAIFNNRHYQQIPVMLRGSDGHTAWANRQMLKKAGINKAMLDGMPPDLVKYFKRTASGESTGFLAEDAVTKVASGISDQTNWPVAAEKAMTHLSSLGITAWLDPSAGNTRSDTSIFLNAYARLQFSGRLQAHIVATVVANADADPISQINMFKRIREKYQRGEIRLLGFKIFADGVVEFPTQTAALSKPYSNTGKSGVLMFESANFKRFAAAADSAGLLVHVHAIGDRAVTETLNGFEFARKKNISQNPLPHSITHLQFVLPTDFPRFKSLNILSSLQLLWAYGDVTTIDIIKPYISPSIYKWQYPAKSLHDAGAVIAGASDWPVSSANPFEAIATAETRKGGLGILNASECLPRLEMFYGYTIEAARVLWMEKEIGSLEPGKSADLVLLDRDIFTVSANELAQTGVLWTMFRGKIIFREGNH